MLKERSVVCPSWPAVAKILSLAGLKGPDLCTQARVEECDSGWLGEPAEREREQRGRREFLLREVHFEL